MYATYTVIHLIHTHHPQDKDATQPCTPAAVLGNVFDTFAAPPPAATAAGGVHDVVPDTQALLHDVQEEEEEGYVRGISRAYLYL